MNNWKSLLYEETRKEYYRDILNFVEQDRRRYSVYPARENVFNAFKLTPLHKVQVVILGQDPYHGPDQAHGLSFSVPRGEPIPPSLVNIFKEVREDIDTSFAPKHGDLTGWARQGVLLLNSFLTVRRGKPESHSKIGWARFTDTVIDLIDRELGEDCVYLLWGNRALAKRSLIGNGKILITSHPSPMSVFNGFDGCRHFSKANEYLRKHGRSGIDWTLLD